MGYSKQQAKAFIEYIAPIIQREGFARGYQIVSTTIAQAIIEGAAGTSKLAKEYKNHFGLKAGSKWKGASVNMKTGEYYSGKYTEINWSKASATAPITYTLADGTPLTLGAGTSYVCVAPMAGSVSFA